MIKREIELKRRRKNMRRGKMKDLFMSSQNEGIGRKKIILGKKLLSI
jgi:hypothetical protein